MMLVVWPAVKANFTIQGLSGNVYIEEISKVHLFHEDWKLIIGINMTAMENRLNAIDVTIRLTKTACNQECTPAREISLIKKRYSRLIAKNNLLRKLLGRQRTKRGLMNFIGDISKTLFGTLSETDLTLINSEFDNMCKDNKNIANILKNHTKILKLILDSSSVDHDLVRHLGDYERDSAKNISVGLNRAAKDSFVNSKLLLASIMIDETNEDIDMAINAINDGKHGIVHPQILTPKILKDTIKDFEERHRTRYHFDNEEENYQHIIDISQVSVAVIKGLFTYVIEIPVLEKEEGSLQKIIPIPEKVNGVHLSIVPDHDLIVKYRDSYVPTDLITIDKCKQISEYKICKRNQPNMKLLDSKTCEASLYRRYADNNCNRSPYLLHKETFIPINNGYIIIPLDKLTIDISCIDGIKSIDLIKPAKITGSNCKIYNNYDQLDLYQKMTDKYIEWLNVTYETHYDQTDLEKLKDRLIQLPKQINTDKLRRARLILDDTENILETIATHRRVKTWKETSLEWL